MGETSITLTIDGTPCHARPGQTILQAARDHGVEVPTLCDDPRLPPSGSCLLCVVEVEGTARLLLSCATEVRAGMVIRTSNDRIRATRKYLLDLLLSNHYADCRGPCYENCPAGVDVQGYLALAAAGKHAEALSLIRETNPLPSVCGRVCVRYCEANCRRAQADSAVAVNFIKRYVADLESGHLPRPVPHAPNGSRVAIVGGGPGGLAAAYGLSRRGYAVRIYDKHPKLGGMLRYGIPDYRLPQDVLDREIEYILGFGVEVRTGWMLGVDFSLDDLKQEGFTAILLALGAATAKPMAIQDEDTPGVVGGIDFLEQVKTHGPPDLRGHVVVVGGGNTAIDAARTALRCNASKVSILYRRTREEMPADDAEIEDALAEGVDIRFLVAPLAVVAEHGRVKALRCHRMELGEPDESGRRRPVPLAGSEHDIVCNTIIAAIGQDVDLAGTGIGGERLGATKRNTLKADRQTCQTSVPWVFAAGDAVSGPAAAVDAIGGGRRAADAIDHYLQSGTASTSFTEFLSRKTSLGEIPADFFACIPRVERAEMRQTPPDDRVRNFLEVDRGMAPEAVHREAARCLSCGCSAVFTCDLKRYAGEYGVDQSRLKGRVRKYTVDSRHPFIELDPNKCILCGRCVRLCADLIKIGALGFVRRGFDTMVRPSLERPLQRTSCISCGNCIEACPTGAIDYRMPFEKPGPWRTEPHESVCSYCGVGCRIVYNKKDDDIWHVSARMRDRYTNGDLCVRGRFGQRYSVDGDRVRGPRVLEDGQQRLVGLEVALDRAVAGLNMVASRDGAGAVAFLVSPKATNEEVYLIQKLAREVFRTNNISSFSHLAGSGDEADLVKAFGLSASTVAARQLEEADVILTVNADLTEENPVLAFHVKRAIRLGAELVAISSTGTRISDIATTRLGARRGTDTVLLNAVISEIIRTGRHDRAFLKARASGFETFARALPADLASTAQVTGVERHEIESLARLLSEPGRRVCIVYDADASFERSPRDLQAIANLLIITGRVGLPGSGLVLARRHSNSQGLVDLGAFPEAVHGRGDRWHNLQGARTLPGLRRALAAGQVKALFIFGENPALDERYAELVRSADVVVAMDMFDTETSRAATVVLPGSGYAESAGSVTSVDRRVQAFAPAFRAPAGPTGVEVVAALYAAATGRPVPSLDEVRAEIAVFNPRYAPIARVGNRGGFCWNHPVPRDPAPAGFLADGAEPLFGDRFATPDGRAHLVYSAEPPGTSPREAISFSTIDAFFEHQSRRLLAPPP
jgi:formate dehydrogenase major subunit